MTPPVRRANASAGTPSKPDAYEVLYNTAVQAFVRRDHNKTQASLEKLLALTKKLPRDPVPWYVLTPGGAVPPSEGLSGEEWVTKTLKLAISANASLYSDPPRGFSAASALNRLLPPAPPSAMLDHIKHLCTSTYGSTLLPPQLISTFLLAALKLRPAEPALAFAHQLAEEWFTALPDAFVEGIAQPPATANPTTRKRTDAAREGYLKVVELFVGEILGREGEWEMARGILQGEMVMGSKKKEALYRHLRALENQRSATPSPTSSGILPSPASSGTLPSTPTKAGRRSRASTGSSSSSEATARPTGAADLSRTLRAQKGKARDESEGGDSTIQPTRSEGTAVPDKIYVRHGSDAGPSARHGHARGSSSSNDASGVIRTGLHALLPHSLATRLEALYASGWLGPALLPFPIVLILIWIGVQRRRRRNAPAVAQLSVRDRLRAARMGGLGAWVSLWLRWWVEKIAGVWKLGTTITYM